LHVAWLSSEVLEYLVVGGGGGETMSGYLKRSSRE
jgi:hypothetical protein